MAVSNVSVTMTKDQLFEGLCVAVQTKHHEVLREEIARRWPNGMKITVHLVLPGA